jgi:hypothetical protein
VSQLRCPWSLCVEAGFNPRAVYVLVAFVVSVMIRNSPSVLVLPCQSLPTDTICPKFVSSLGAYSLSPFVWSLIYPLSLLVLPCLRYMYVVHKIQFLPHSKHFRVHYNKWLARGMISTYCGARNMWINSVGKTQCFKYLSRWYIYSNHCSLEINHMLRKHWNNAVDISGYQNLRERESKYPTGFASC